MRYEGIDVSKWQGNIDFSKVKSTGIQFVIARIGYGMYENQKDAEFEDNYYGATKNNLPIGVYLYSYALNTNDALREAEVVLKWLNNRKLNLPVYYDIEDKSQTTLSKETLTSMCETFCSRIEKAGYWAGVYANKYWLTTHLDYKRLEEKYTIWVAQWNNTNTYKGKYDMWQYTSSGKVNGINGNVDMNILYRDIFTNMNQGSPNDNQVILPDLSGYTGTSIVDALKNAGYDSSFDTRERLYKQAGFTGTYLGTAEQNLALLRKLGGNTNATTYYPIPDYHGFSIVDALKKIGVDSSFDNRVRIANKNGISNYRGYPWQNLKLLNLLKKGLLKK